MKLPKKLFTLTLLASLSSLSLGGTAFAASNNEDAVDSKSTINFVKSLEEEDIETPGIIDPETVDPENPENPNPNPNPEGNLLRINYVSDFDFGTWGSTSHAITAFAKAQPIHLVGGGVQDVAPFVSTIDNRGSERGNGWTLSAKASELTDENDNILRGAQIILSNGTYSNSELAPEATLGEKNITAGQQVIATTTAETGAGQWSMALGVLKEFTTQLPSESDSSILEEVTYNVTDGVRIEVPRNTVTNTTEYSGTITWELETSV